MTAQARLSVVIGTLNRRDSLRRCLESLLRETSVPVRVFVTDAGSTDGTIGLLEGFGDPRVVPILVGERLGQARAYNDVFARVDTPFVAWLSDDNEVVNRGLDVAVGILERRPRIGMVALKVQDVTGPFASAPYIGGLSSVGILNVNQGVLRTEVLRRAGGFSEAFRDYGIDPDLTAKVLLGGHDIVYTRPVALRHYRDWGPGTDSPQYRHVIERNHAGWTLYARKYRPLLPPDRRWRTRQALARTLGRIARLRWDAPAGGGTRSSAAARDVMNTLSGRFVSLADPLRSLGRDHHLLQRCPRRLLPAALPPDLALDELPPAPPDPFERGSPSMPSLPSFKTLVLAAGLLTVGLLPAGAALLLGLATEGVLAAAAAGASLAVVGLWLGLKLNKLLRVAALGRAHLLEARDAAATMDAAVRALDATWERRLAEHGEREAARQDARDERLDTMRRQIEIGILAGQRTLAEGIALRLDGLEAIGRELRPRAGEILARLDEVARIAEEGRDAASRALERREPAVAPVPIPAPDPAPLLGKLEQLRKELRFLNDALVAPQAAASPAEEPGNLLSAYAKQRWTKHRRMVGFARAVEESRIRELFLAEIFPDIDQVVLPVGAVHELTGHANHVDMLYVCAIARLREARRLFEFGTYQGRTSYHLTYASPEARVTTLNLPAEADPRASGLLGSYFRGKPRAERITQLLGDSRELDTSKHRGAFDFIFVDGSHEYELVENDTRKAFEMLAPGGVIVWHDYAPKSPELVRFFRDFTQERPLFRIKRTCLLLHLDGVDPLRFEALPLPPSLELDLLGPDSILVEEAYHV